MTSRIFSKSSSQRSQPQQQEHDPYAPNPYLQNPYQPHAQPQQQWHSYRPLPNRGNPSRISPQMPNPLQPQVNPVHIPAPAPRRLQNRNLPSNTQPQSSQNPNITIVPLSATKIRDLRDLIRHRYALDVEIWSTGQRVKWYQRETVLAKMAQADAALVAIKLRLDAWDKSEYFPDRAAWMRFREIKSRVLGAKVRNWKMEPPWKREEGEVEGVRVGVHEADGRNI